MCVHLKPGPVHTDNGVARLEAAFFSLSPLFLYSCFCFGSRQRERGWVGGATVVAAASACLSFDKRLHSRSRPTWTGVFRQATGLVASEGEAMEVGRPIDNEGEILER